MSDLDGLINSKISLISQDDVKFDGTLYSINAEESSMVLKDGKGRTMSDLPCYCYLVILKCSSFLCCSKMYGDRRSSYRP